MPLVTVIVVLVIAGLAMWLVNTYVPMAEGVKRLLNIAVVVILVLWLLRALGLFAGLSSIRV